jgi:nitrous oxidase accessory protein NosD
MRSLRNLVVILLSLLVTVAAALTAPASAMGRMHLVRPGDSIQKAVDDASPGDTIVVKAGTYWESVAIQKSGITVRAQGKVTLRPPEDGSGLCNQPGEMIGFCVIPADIDFNTGEYATRTADVTITGFRIVGFEGDGVFGFGTRDLTVMSVHAVRNSEYGIASFDGVGTTFSHNAANGSAEAGLYVGDSPHADARVMMNRTWNNLFGVLVRHTHDVSVVHNTVTKNCLGIFLLDDGQAEGSGDNAVVGNWVRANNRTCEIEEIPGSPAVGGGGIIAAGSQHNLIAHNTVRRNRGDTMFSGGIVLVSGAMHNLVTHNRLSGNRPADIVQDESSSSNRFVANQCRTSMPDGLCGHGMDDD